MFILKAEKSFDSAHFLKGYDGKCRNIHGHRWKVIVEVQSEKLIEKGELRSMVVDFGDLKDDIKEIADYFDHSLIIEKDSLNIEIVNLLKKDNFSIIEVDFRPTAEEFSKHIYELMSEKNYDVKRVTVYETPNNSATYEV